MKDIERRLARLEGGGAGTSDIAGLLEAARRRGIARMREVGPEAYRAECRAEELAQLADVEARHAVRPFRGVMLLHLEGTRRALAQDAPPRPAG